MTTGYESIMFLLAWYSTSTTLFAAILSPAFLNDSITFFGTIGKGIVSLLQEFDHSYCYGNFIHHDGITDSLDWLSGGENLPEILLGYHQYHDGDK